MKENELNILIGIPGSGKTTFAKSKLFENCIYLSSDEIRKELYGFENQEHNNEVFDLLHKRLFSALEQGVSVIYDATNLSEKRRKNIIERAKKYATVNAYLMCSPIAKILERNMGRKRKIPWDKLETMVKTIQCPMYYEGFDNIYLIDTGMENENYDYKNLLKKCDIPQENPYHYETLKEHIEKATELTKEKRKKIKFSIDYRILETAVKYHDMGKLYTKTYNPEKGYFTYYNHENISTYIFLCQIAKTRLRDRKNRVKLCDSDYQTAFLIQNHMKFYNGNIHKLKGIIKDDDLFNSLELLHEADENSRIGI